MQQQQAFFTAIIQGGSSGKNFRPKAVFLITPFTQREYNEIHYEPWCQYNEIHYK